VIRRTTKIGLEIAAVCLAGVAVGVGLLAWRLTSGPISIDFLSPYLEEALSAADASYVVRVDDTVLTWGGWGRPVEVLAVGLRAIQADGAVRVNVPQMTVRLSARALMRGRVAPTSLEVLGPSLRVARMAEGRFAFGLESDDAAAPPFLPRLVATLLGAPRGGRGGYLSHIRITDADLTYEDLYLGRSWQAKHTDVAFERDALGIRATVALDVDTENGIARIDAVGVYDRMRQNIDVGVRFSGLEPAQLVPEIGALAALESFKVALDGTLTVAMDSSGFVSEAGFEVRGGEGTIDLPELFRERLSIKRLEARGRLLDAFRRLTVDDLVIDLGGPTIGLSGDMREMGGTRSARLGVSLRNVPADDLDRYWPLGVAANGRDWMVRNTADGIVDEVTADLRLTHDADGFGFDSVRGAARFHDATIIYLKSHPPVRHARGTANFTAEGIDVKVTGGEVEDVHLREAVVHLTDFHKPDQFADITGTVEGRLSDILRLVDRPPYRYVEAIGLKPDALDGAAKARFAVKFPLIDALTFAQVDIAAEAELSGVGWRNVLFGIDMTEGDLHLDLDKSGLQVAGLARLAGVQSQLTWNERFGNKVPFRRRMTVEGRLDDSLRRQLGIAIERHLSGPVDARVTMTSLQSGESRVEAAADLRPARLDLPDMGWQKLPGQPGKASVSMLLQDETLREVTRFAVEAPGLRAGGRATFAPDGGHATAVELDLMVDETTDAAIRAQRRNDGAYGVVVSGERFDISRLLKNAGRNGESDAPVFVLDANIGRLFFAPDRFISGAKVDGEFDGKDWRSLGISAQVGAGKTLTVRYGPVGRSRILVVRSDDAGAALHDLGVVDSVTGGTLELKGSINEETPDKPFAGTLVVNDYRVVNAPTLAKMFTLASLQGIADVLAGEAGIGFTDLTATYEYADDIVRIIKGRARGSEVGITLRGNVDLSQDKVDLAGTLVPAYTLNSILGNIPLLGRILVGEEGSGIFAATYRVTGALDDPEVTVNPLAALTPGLFRLLFQIFTGAPEDLEDAPEDPPGNTSDFVYE